MFLEELQAFQKANFRSLPLTMHAMPYFIDISDLLGKSLNLLVCRVINAQPANLHLRLSYILECFENDISWRIQMSKAPEQFTRVKDRYVEE